jgi:hypothetical protein
MDSSTQSTMEVLWWPNGRLSSATNIRYSGSSFSTGLRHQVSALHSRFLAISHIIKETGALTKNWLAPEQLDTRWDQIYVATYVSLLRTHVAFLQPSDHASYI